MDNLFLFAKDLRSLEENTKRVLQRLLDNDLYLKPRKCEFTQTKVEWLGMIIEENRICGCWELKGIRDWPIPTTVKEVRGFLGFGNFYQRFIQHYSNIAKPLNDMTKKRSTFQLDDRMSTGF